MLEARIASFELAFRMQMEAPEAFALDPLAGRGDLRQTDAMVEELMAGTAEWLPQFA